MPLKPPSSPRSSLYLITPPLSVADAGAFAERFAEVLDVAPIACALVRMAPGAETEAKAIVAPILQTSIAADCALLIEDDARLAGRLGVDGVHVAGAGDDLIDAIERMKPGRIVGAGSMRLRDEAMTAGEKGADYVMFGEPFGGVPTMSPNSLTERVRWWAEIFETPCVAYADTFEQAGILADAGADFVALDEAIWSAVSPARAAREAHALLARAAARSQ
jgi:thiamine-phosphate pyrophosphorylase